MNAGLIAIAVGGAAITALVAWFGAQAIGHEVLEAGWAIPATIGLHVVQLFLSAYAWRFSVGTVLPGLGTFFRIRWVRESVNSLLPVAQLGGNLVGIRLLALRGVPGAVAGAGTTLDLTIEALTQLVFTLLGIGALASIDHERSWAPWVGGGLATMAVGLAGFIVAQRAGLLRIVELLAARLGRFFPSLAVDAVRGLHQELMRLQQDRGALTRATLLHLLAWLLGVGETWLALAAMGVHIGAAEALVIESLGMAARSAGFAVPGALGVQETGFILVCGLFGIEPDTAIALSMVKRVRELAVGIPGLVAWQWTEGRRILKSPSDRLVQPEEAPMPMTNGGPDYPAIAAAIGLTALRARLPALTGAGVQVGQVEASASGTANGVDYEVRPSDIGHPADNSDGFITYYDGLSSTSTYNDGTTGSYSSHASYVSTFLDGKALDQGVPTGVAPGIAHLDNYDADQFLTNLQLGYADKVVNLSFTYGGTTSEDSAFDAAALSNNTVFVASAGNSGTPASPSSAYNVISVDSSTAVLAIGPAADGVPKPDISAPQIATSYTAPIVAGAAVLLVQAGTAGYGGNSAQTEADAVDFRTIKALLLNGATKPTDYFTTQYAPTATQPLNAVYGSGVVNINNSVAELQGGEQQATASYAVASGGSPFRAATGASITSTQGWALSTATTQRGYDSVGSYAIRLAAGQSFVATLTWASNSSNAIDHFSLSLYRNATGTLLARSAASSSNVQQIIVTPGAAGVYDLAVDLQGATLAINSDKYALAFAQSAVACFAPGTRILTTTGDVAVERLEPGDWLVTADGATRPVAFVGRRRSHPEPGRINAPIRVHRGAFGAALPARDLLLSPDHAVAMTDAAGPVLVPIHLLVNDRTIVQEPGVRVQTYFHVELDWHDVILAEGLPVESYLDTGNRDSFENALPVTGPPARPCAPLLVRGERLQAIRRRLAARASVPA